MNKKWYEKTWFIIVMLITVFPVGIFFMWKLTNWKKPVKIIITVVLALIGTITLFSGMGDNSIDYVDTTENTTIFEETLIEETIETTPTTTDSTTVKDLNVQTTLATTQESLIVPTTTETATKKQPTTEKQNTTEKQTTTEKETTQIEYEPEYSSMVWIPQSGSKYHSHAGCSGMKNPSQVSLESAQNMGYTPCSRCY